MNDRLCRAIETVGWPYALRLGIIGAIKRHILLAFSPGFRSAADNCLSLKQKMKVQFDLCG